MPDERRAGDMKTEQIIKALASSALAFFGFY